MCELNFPPDISCLESGDTVGVTHTHTLSVHQGLAAKETGARRKENKYLEERRKRQAQPSGRLASCELTSAFVFFSAAMS